MKELSTEANTVLTLMQEAEIIHDTTIRGVLTTDQAASIVAIAHLIQNERKGRKPARTPTPPIQPTKKDEGKDSLMSDARKNPKTPFMPAVKEAPPAVVKAPKPPRVSAIKETSLPVVAPPAKRSHKKKAPTPPPAAPAKPKRKR